MTTEIAPAKVRLSDQLGPDGKLHADGYFTWHRRDGYVLDAKLPAEFVLAEKVRAELERQKCQINGLMFDALGEPRTRHVRVTLDGNNCVMTPVDGDRYVQDARDAGDDTDYEVADVYLSAREFEDLPEHDGF